MSLLQQESLRISDNLVKLQNELENQKAETIKAIDDMTEEFKIASAQGDHSENAAFSEAKSKLSMYNVTLSILDTRLKSIANKVDESNYKSIGLVTLYSTVKLEIPDGREFVYKLYPEGVSDINKGILAADSPVGRAIWLKEVGDIVTLEHIVTGEPIRYKIKDIY